MIKDCVLFSIKPEYCDLIRKRIKTIEVRKTKPNIKSFYKGYIYETRNGGVIGEFLCDGYYTIPYDKTLKKYVLRYSFFYPSYALDRMQLSMDELCEYGKGKTLYGLCISKLKMYDEPINIKDFGLKRPPQSWCYVNEYIPTMYYPQVPGITPIVVKEEKKKGNKKDDK